MSIPGSYTDAELTQIGAGQRLASAYAPSWLAASAVLKARFGFAPIVSVTDGKPLGAYRTRAQQRSLSPASPDLSDHCKGRACDIGNQRAFRNIDEADFIAILAEHGWHNVNTSGNPFPSEPWHFANQSASPAGGGTKITTQKEVRPMFRAALRNTQKVAYFDSISFFETTNGSVDDNAWGRFVGKPGLTVSQDEWDSYERVAAANAVKVGTPGSGAASLVVKLEGTATPA